MHSSFKTSLLKKTLRVIPPAVQEIQIVFNILIVKAAWGHQTISQQIVTNFVLMLEK